MQKFIRIAAIVAVSLTVLSILLLLISYPLQESIASSLGVNLKRIYKLLPIFPTLSFRFVCLRLVCIAALLFFCYRKSDSICPEILVLICLFAILPLFQNRMETVNSYVISFRGSNILSQDWYTADSLVNGTISKFCLIFSNAANAVTCVVCGMSIVSKRLNRKYIETLPQHNPSVMSENFLKNDKYFPTA